MKNKLRVLSSLLLIGATTAALTACGGKKETSAPVATTTTSAPVATTTTSAPVATTTTSAPVATTTTSAPVATTTTSAPVVTTTTSAAPVVDEVVLETTNVQSTFTVGDEFTTEGLQVSLMYSDGSESEILAATEYTVAVFAKDDVNFETPITSLDVAGDYVVQVTVGNKSARYNIKVKAEMFNVSASVRLGASDTATTNDFTSAKTVYSNTIDETAIKFVPGIDSNGGYKSKIESNSLTFHSGEADEVKFTHRFSVGITGTVDQGCIKIKTEGAAKLSLYARSSSTDERTCTIVSSDGQYSDNTHKVSAIAKIEYDLPSAGEYTFYMGGNGYVYGVDLVYEVESSTVEFSNLAVSQSSVKKVEQDATFDASKYEITADTNYGTKAVIDPAKVTFTGYNTATPGVQTVTATYAGQNATFKLSVVGSDAAFATGEITTEATTTVFKQGADFSAAGVKVTFKDQYEVETVLDVEDEELACVIKNSEGQVITEEAFKTAPKGIYTVELTSGAVTKTYNISVLEIKDVTFTYDETIGLNATAYGPKAIIEYTNGTETSFASLNDEVAATAEGFAMKFFADATTTQESTLASLTTAIGTIYCELAYTASNSQTYTKARFAISVGEVSAFTKSFNSTSLKNDYTADTTLSQALVVGDFTISSANKVKANAASIELAKQNGSYISFTVDSACTITIEFSSTGGSNASDIGLYSDSTCATQIGETQKTTGTSKKTVTFEVASSGTYYVAAPSESSDTSSRGCRVYTIVATNVKENA